ncbi:MAG: penicillin-binding protein 2, partial [Burkholderiales bacterium]
MKPKRGWGTEVGALVWRARALLWLLSACFVGLLGRAAYLQGLHNDFLQQKGDSRYSRVIKISANRGMIVDRHGEPLAISTPVESVWASPADVRASTQQLDRLAKLLGSPPADFKKRLSAREREFVYLKRRIPPDLAASVVQ